MILPAEVVNALLCVFTMAWVAIRVVPAVNRWLQDQAESSNRTRQSLDALIEKFSEVDKPYEPHSREPTKDEIIAQQRERIVDLEAKLAQQAHPFR